MPLRVDKIAKQILAAMHSIQEGELYRSFEDQHRIEFFEKLIGRCLEQTETRLARDHLPSDFHIYKSELWIDRY